MANLGAPNFLKVIDAYEAGADRAEKSRLRDLAEHGRQLSGQYLATGDKNLLADLYRTSPEMGMQAEQFTQQKKKYSREEQASMLDEAASVLMGADTPEKYTAAIQQLKAKGHTFDPPEEQFSGRQGLLDQAMGWKAKLAQSNEDRTFDAQQRNSDRAYRLDVQQFGLAQANANWQRKMDQAKLDAQSPDLVEIYDGPSGQPYKARWNPQTQQYDRVGGIKAPSGTSLEVGPDGAVSFTQGMGKPPNEGQSKDTGYLTRMTGAIPTIDQHENALLSLGENVGGRAPLGLGNYLKSSEYQQAEQAGGEFLAGLLRKDSGGAITKEEKIQYGDLYLPRPGDKKEVLAQKRAARKRAALGIKMGLPAHLIANMERNGVDLSVLNGQPGAQGGAGAQGGGKSDRGSGTTRSGNQFKLVQ